MKLALKKALENWIKLAISQSGPAAMLKQKGLVHFHEHTGRNCACGCFSLISTVFSRELLSKGGQISLQASLFSVSSFLSSPTILSIDLRATPFDSIQCLVWQIIVHKVQRMRKLHFFLFFPHVLDVQQHWILSTFVQQCHRYHCKTKKTKAMH